MDSHDFTIPIQPAKTVSFSGKADGPNPEWSWTHAKKGDLAGEPVDDSPAGFNAAINAGSRQIIAVNFQDIAITDFVVGF